jgi:hypothetical protein
MTSLKTTIFAKIDVGKGHRRPGAKKTDCTVRALSVAAAVSYDKAWATLYEFQGFQKSNHFDLGALIEDHFIDLPILRLSQAADPKWTVKRALSFPAVKGKPRMTPATFVRANPSGRFVLSLAHHVVAVRGGIVIDTWDCTRRCVYKAWEIELPASGQK